MCPKSLALSDCARHGTLYTLRAELRELRHATGADGGGGRRLRHAPWSLRSPAAASSLYRAAPSPDGGRRRTIFFLFARTCGSEGKRRTCRRGPFGAIRGRQGGLPPSGRPPSLLPALPWFPFSSPTLPPSPPSPPSPALRERQGGGPHLLHHRGDILGAHAVRARVLALAGRLLRPFLGAGCSGRHAGPRTQERARNSWSGLLALYAAAGFDDVGAGAGVCITAMGGLWVLGVGREARFQKNAGKWLIPASPGFTVEWKEEETRRISGGNNRFARALSIRVSANCSCSAGSAGTLVPAVLCVGNLASVAPVCPYREPCPPPPP